MCGCLSDEPEDPEAGTDAGQDCDSSVTPCPLSDLSVRVLDARTGKPIPDAEVTVDGLGSKQSDVDGWATWEKIPAGSYDASARKEGYHPDPGTKGGIEVPESSKIEAEIELETPALHMHVDNDRDGTVNDDWDQNNKWESGAGKKGTVIRCNNDDEDSDKTTDCENDKIDGGADVPDIAPLFLRKAPAGRKFPAGWKAVLSVSDKDRIRIFDKHAGGGVEIIGPAKGSSFDVTDLNPDEHKLGMEGVTYPDSAFDGKVTLTLKLLDDTGTEVHSENAIVRISPWIMFHHACVTTKVYVVATTDNVTFRSELSKVVSGAGKSLQVASGGGYGDDDRWMQDIMEPGFSTLPGTGAPETRNLPVTLRTGHDRTLDRGAQAADKFPKNDLLGPDYGFTQALSPASGSSLDSFGNLECSPPFKHGPKGRDYKFGRIVFGGGGRQMLPKVRKFLGAQIVQEPFEINTDWLVVGHVDEVMSFLPDPSAPKKFKVALASPKLAMTIVNGAPNSAKLFQGIAASAAQAAQIATDFPLKTAGAIKSNAAFKTVQTTVQAKIDGIKGTLKTELDLKDSDFIDLPVLFTETGGRFIAYTPGVVNMLVITKSPSSLVLCVPKPFGPIVSGSCLFEAKVNSQLKKIAGVKIHFVDDFTTYHMQAGEIHCGTNSQRTPPSDRWWWELDWI